MKKTKKIISAILLLSVLTSFCAINSYADYIMVHADTFKEYNYASELAFDADVIFEGTLTGIRFEIRDNKTGLPLDVNDPPEGTDQIDFGSLSGGFGGKYSFYTVYVIDVSKTYKGKTDNKAELYLDYGLINYKEDEQLKLISDLGFKNENDTIWYLEIGGESGYGSHIDIGKSYLFFAKNAPNGTIKVFDQYNFAFGSDYPKSGSYSKFAYSGLIAYLTGEEFIQKSKLPGDINGDEMVDATDIILLKRHILSAAFLAGDMFSAGDIDGNCKIDSTDYLRLKRMMLGVGSEYHVYEDGQYCITLDKNGVSKMAEAGTGDYVKLMNAVKSAAKGFNILEDIKDVEWVNFVNYMLTIDVPHNGSDLPDYVYYSAYQKDLCISYDLPGDYVWIRFDFFFDPGLSSYKDDISGLTFIPEELNDGVAYLCEVKNYSESYVTCWLRINGTLVRCGYYNTLQK
ncbi:MAG: dockerin type I repeat-containing protein, partial [Clostridia bacterium]|nr:dockerin type I repeat-containing protein [Clostridia bacterium]